mgnify:FL=1
MKNIGIIIKKILRLWIRNQSEKLLLRVSPKIYSLCHSYVLEKTTCVYRIKRDGIHLRKRIKKRILKWRRQNSRSAQYV